MLKGLYLVPLLLLAACADGDYETEVCQAAVQGLPYADDNYNKCVQDLWRARFAADHQAAQKYRDMPR